MTRLYEGMFLLDNDLVRAGWPQAKQRLTETLTKHGASVETARRWGERRLAYPIKKKNRATFLLAYFQLPTDAMAGLVRDLEIGDLVMRHLIVSVEAVSEDERKLAAAEDSSDFVVPEPPADDVVEARPRRYEEEDPYDDDGPRISRGPRRSGRDSDRDGQEDDVRDDSSSEPAMAGGSNDKQED